MGIGKVCFTGGSIGGKLQASSTSHIDLQETTITGDIQLQDVHNFVANGTVIDGDLSAVRCGTMSMPSCRISGVVDARNSDSLLLSGGAVLGNLSAAHITEVRLLDMAVAGLVDITNCNTVIYDAVQAEEMTGQHIGHLLSSVITHKMTLLDSAVMDSSSLVLIAENCTIQKNGHGTLELQSCSLQWGGTGTLVAEASSISIQGSISATVTESQILAVGSDCVCTGTGFGVAHDSDVTGMTGYLQHTGEGQVVLWAALDLVVHADGDLLLEGTNIHFNQNT